jgi:GntP family gluconate:H+ symporter
MATLIHSPYWPFFVLFLGVVAVVLMITVWRFHSFVALMLAAIFVGLISINLPGVEGQPHLIKAIELPMIEFGIMAGKIAWVIALAAIIGVAMMESGAAERIVNFLLERLGENRAALALMTSAFILSIPVFFDTVFFLLIPLAIALAIKTGKHFVLYVVAMSGGGAITHSIVPPTPGPLIMAETLQIDLGVTIIGGILLGIIPAMVALWLAKLLDRKLNIPVRIGETNPEQLESRPGLLLSFLPILLPIGLISMASIVAILNGNVPSWLAFLGNKNIAMGIGMAIALWLWARIRDLSARELWDAVSKPLEIAGVIILITSAGGAFGAMIKLSGIGAAIETATENFHIHYIILAWVIAAVMKTAQGSSTVAMITSASIMYGLIGTGTELPYHPIYLLMAIGFGSLFISWMNDSGFWVVSKLSGFTVKEALQTLTVSLALISLVGLTQVLLLSWVLPMK